MAPMNRTAREGLIVGLIAYASVALFYAAFDLLAARGLFYTVDLLGKTLFQGLRDQAVLGLPIAPDMAGVFWYNAFHLGASLAIGLVVTGLVEHAERHPFRRRLVFLVIIAGFVVTIFGVALLTSPIRPLLPWWSIVVANTTAVLFAGSYLLKAHPGIAGRLIRGAATA